MEFGTTTLKLGVSRVPRLGAWILGLGLGAALLGFPLFMVFDPMALFTSAFGWAGKELSSWEIAAASIFPVLVILAAVAPWLWCGRLCPLGALQDVVAVIKQSVTQLCGSSGDSPSHATLSSGRKVDAGRRVFLGLGIGAAYRLLLNPADLEAKSGVTRPPLSGSEARFTRLCSRCGACVRACPEGIIRQGGMDCGFAGVLAPELDFSRGGCLPECISCGRACPTGAIPRFTEQDKFEHPLGLAVLKKELCVLTHDRECGVCMNACPHRAITILWDPVDMVSALSVNQGLCTGCGVCQHVCPEKPAAIVVEAQKW